MTKPTKREAATIAPDSYAFISMPPSPGSWKISGSLSIHVAKRPRWLTRLMMRWLLEWEWEDQ